MNNKQEFPEKINGIINIYDDSPDNRITTDATPTDTTATNEILKKPVFVKKSTHLDYIYSFLEPQEQTFFADTCRWTHDQLKKKNLAAILCLLVAQGKQDTVEEMVKKHPELLLQKGNVTDYSGRTFINITPFQYALWALDSRMCTAIIKHIPKEEEGRAVTKSLLTQFEELKQHGLTYTVDGQIIDGEKHFSFDRLLDAYHTHINNWPIWSRTTTGEARKHWREEVSVAQYYLPAHVAQEYCNGNLFFFLPEFKGRQFKDKQLKRSIIFHNYATNEYQAWWTPKDPKIDDKWGLNYTFFWRPFGGVFTKPDEVTLNLLNALIAFRNERTEDIELLKPLLLSKLECGQANMQEASCPLFKL